MSVLTRWRDRLQTRKALEATARKRYIWHPTTAGKVLLKTRRGQVAEAQRVLKRHAHDDTSAAKAVKWALSQVGTVEQPAGSNWGPKISDWIKATGYSGPVPYCQCGANAAAVHGGAPQLRTGYTPTVLGGLGGYKPVPVSKAKLGDFVYFKWPGVSNDTCDHVGILVAITADTVECVEFNTSPGNAGSQNNGGGVYVRTRSRSLVVGAVRPPYPG